MLNLSSIESAIKTAVSGIPTELKSFVASAIGMAAQPSVTGASATGTDKRNWVVALIAPLVSVAETTLHTIVQGVYDEIKSLAPAPLQPLVAAAAPLVQTAETALDAKVEGAANALGEQVASLGTGSAPVPSISPPPAGVPSAPAVAAAVNALHLAKGLGRPPAAAPAPAPAPAPTQPLPPPVAPPVSGTASAPTGSVS